MVLAFNFLRSMQNHKLPSFFLMSTTGLAHGLLDLQIAPISSISRRCFLTSLNWCGGILLYHSLNGIGLFTLMVCFTKLVLPNSNDFRAKISSKSFIVCSASIWHSLLQVFIPLNSNFSINFSILFFFPTCNWPLFTSLEFSFSSMNQGAILFGTKLAAANSATTFPSAKVMTSFVMFLNIIVIFCEPGIHTEYVGIVTI